MADAVHSITVSAGLQPARFAPSPFHTSVAPEAGQGRYTPSRDLLWDEVNALGGIPTAGSDYDRGYCDAVSQVLSIIEALPPAGTLTNAGEI